MCPLTNPLSNEAEQAAQGQATELDEDDLLRERDAEQDRLEIEYDRERFAD
jgi:hypothetical protein